jgi:RHS repeat-associated protein
LSAVTDAFGNVTSIEHDASGNPTAIVAPFGQRTTLSVDANGYLNSITDPTSKAHQVAYTADGLLTSFTNPNGHASTMYYDGSGRLIKDTNAAAGSQSFGRTDITNGHQVARTTGLGRTTTYRIEDLTTGDQRRTKLFPDGTQIITLNSTNGSHTTTLADGTVTTRIDGPDPRLGMLAAIPTSVTRTTGGLTATVTTARTVNLTDSNNPFSLTSVTDTVAINGRTSTRAYDSLAKTATTTTPAGRSATTIIDTFGRLASAQVSGLFATNNSYDTNGRLVGINQGSGNEARTLTFGYNSQGYLDTLTDPLGRQVRYTYDLAGRMTQQILPDGRAIQCAHDANGNLTSVTPPGKLAHVFHYTAIDQTSNYVPPDVGAGTNSTVYTYDPDKALTSVARPDGQTVILSYDSAGRLSSLSAGLSPSMQVLNSYGYDSTTGKLITITALDGGTLGFTYNGALRTQTTWAGTVAGNIDYAYDSDFRVTSLSVNAANPITFSYDADSLLTQAGALNLTRSAQNGLLTGTSLGTITDSLSFNGFGEITSYTASNGATPIFSTQFTRDPIGRVAEKMETIGALSTTYDYAYDTAGRLTGVKQNGVSGSSYTYDSNGNRLSAPDLAQTPIYDDQDRLLNYGATSYTYTANGELATKSTAASSITSYSYDVLGNLRSVALPGGIQIDYLIDGWNRRIAKKVNGRLTQGFLYQDQLRPIAELDSSNNIVSRFVYAGRYNVPSYLIKNDAIYRIIVDHLGSPRLVVNAMTGQIVQRMDYDVFGSVITDTNPGFQPFGFAGGIYDGDTGLIRLGARDYDPQIGRWTTKDPVRFAGGDKNLYGYAINDPVNQIDPKGLGNADAISTVQSTTGKVAAIATVVNIFAKGAGSGAAATATVTVSGGVVACAGALLAGLTAGTLIDEGITWVNDKTLGESLYDFLHPEDPSGTPLPRVYCLGEVCLVLPP